MTGCAALLHPSVPASRAAQALRAELEHARAVANRNGQLALELTSLVERCCLPGKGGKGRAQPAALAAAGDVIGGAQAQGAPAAAPLGGSADGQAGADGETAAFPEAGDAEAVQAVLQQPAAIAGTQAEENQTGVEAGTKAHPPAAGQPQPAGEHLATAPAGTSPAATARGAAAAAGTLPSSACAVIPSVPAVGPAALGAPNAAPSPCAGDEFSLAPLPAQSRPLIAPDAGVLTSRVEKAVRRHHAAADLERIALLQGLVRTQGSKVADVNNALSAAHAARQAAERSSAEAQLKLQAVAFHLHRFLGYGSATTLTQRAGSAPGAGRAGAPQLALQGDAADGGPRGAPPTCAASAGGAPLPPLERQPQRQQQQGDANEQRCLTCGAMVPHPVLINLLHDTSYIEGARGGPLGPSAPSLSIAAPTGLAQRAAQQQPQLGEAADTSKSLAPGHSQPAQRTRAHSLGQSWKPSELAGTPMREELSGSHVAGSARRPPTSPELKRPSFFGTPSAYIGPSRPRTAADTHGTLYKGLAPQSVDLLTHFYGDSDEKQPALPLSPWLSLRPVGATSDATGPAVSKVAAGARVRADRRASVGTAATTHGRRSGLLAQSVTLRRSTPSSTVEHGGHLVPGIIAQRSAVQ